MVSEFGHGWRGSTKEALARNLEAHQCPGWEWRRRGCPAWGRKSRVQLFRDVLISSYSLCRRLNWSQWTAFWEMSCDWPGGTGQGGENGSELLVTLPNVSNAILLMGLRRTDTTAEGGQNTSTWPVAFYKDPVCRLGQGGIFTVFHSWMVQSWKVNQRAVVTEG